MHASVAPTEAQPPLIVDPDAVLALSVTHQRLQTIARRCPQITQLVRRVQHGQLALRHPLNRPKAPDLFTTKQPFGLLLAEQTDHEIIL